MRAEPSRAGGPSGTGGGRGVGVGVVMLGWRDAEAGAGAALGTAGRSRLRWQPDSCGCRSKPPGLAASLAAARHTQPGAAGAAGRHCGLWGVSPGGMYVGKLRLPRGASPLKFSCSTSVAHPAPPEPAWAPGTASGGPAEGGDAIWPPGQRRARQILPGPESGPSAKVGQKEGQAGRAEPKGVGGQGLQTAW